MLQVNSISKAYGSETILHNISFSLNKGQRLGLIGPNGCGKTTLLRILAGIERPDRGSFHLNPPDLRVGYLPQGMMPAPDETIHSYLDQVSGNLEAVSVQLEKTAAELADRPDHPALQSKYDRLLIQLEFASQNKHKTPAVLAALGLADLPPDTPTSHLSGGQKTRLVLSSVLLSSPQLLLLDEPTNHLDLEMLEWLENWLDTPQFNRASGVLIVSHDRAFLDQTTTGILELETNHHTLKAYAGNYRDYLEAKLKDQERQLQQYSDQQEEIARLRNAIERVRSNAKLRRGGKGDDGDKFAKGFFANRTKGTIARAKHIEDRLERLMGDEKVEKPGQSWQMKLDFSQAASSGRDVLRFENLSVGYGEQTLIRDINLTVKYGHHIAVVGPNGCGKSTLLRTIEGKLQPLAGKVRCGANVQSGTMAQEQDTLDPEKNALTTLLGLAPLSETDARTFLHKYLFSGDHVFTPISMLSYGERARLSLACLVASGCNLLLLDEPINHLDIPSRARFEEALSRFEGTVLAVAHDRFFIEAFAQRVWKIEDKRLTVEF